MKHVIFVRSNPVNPDPGVEKEAQVLVEAGYKVTVLAWNREGEKMIIQNDSDYKIDRFSFRAPYGSIFLIFHLFIWWGYEFFYLIKSNFDIVHCCDFDTVIPGLIVCKLKKKKIVYDIFDFYADCLPKKIPHFVRKIVAFLEKRISNLVDANIIVDECRLKQFDNKLKNHVVIYNTPSKIYPPSKRDKKKNFTLFYAGILDLSRGFESVIKAIDSIDDINLIIAGYGSDEGDIKFMIKNKKNIKFLGKLSYNEVISITLESDCLFALYDPSIPNHVYSSPNKLFEAMICGKPIIVTKGTNMAEIVKRENCGLIIEYNNIDQLRNTIIRLKNNLILANSLGKKGKVAYEKRYNWGIMKK